ncbi:MAG: S41 family peptidase, partial [Flavobacteriaceae bacterium]
QKMSTIYQRGLKSTDIFTTMIDGSVGYIQIPMILNYSGNDSITIAHTLKIRNQLCALEQQGPKGYIIDLRANIGGSFYPMFAGLGELFPNMHLGGDTKNGKEYYSEWTLQNGNLYNNDYAVPNMPALKCGIELGTRRVAVLVGRFTASSGEALASGLRGQNNIRLIGEQTSGASTTNSFRYISDDVQFNPAVAYYMSKDGTVHTDGIIPDQVIVEEYNMDHVLEGKTITEATKWIQYGDTYVPGKSSMD